MKKGVRNHDMEVAVLVVHRLADDACICFKQAVAAGQSLEWAFSCKR